MVIDVITDKLSEIISFFFDEFLVTVRNFQAKFFSLCLKEFSNFLQENFYQSETDSLFKLLILLLHSENIGVGDRGRSPPTLGIN